MLGRVGQRIILHDYWILYEILSRDWVVHCLLSVKL